MPDNNVIFVFPDPINLFNQLLMVQEWLEYQFVMNGEIFGEMVRLVRNIESW